MTLDQFLSLTYSAQARLAKDSPDEYAKLQREKRSRQHELERLRFSARTSDERIAAAQALARMHEPGTLDAPRVAPLVEARSSVPVGALIFAYSATAGAISIDVYDDIGESFFSKGVTAKDVLAKLDAAPAAKVINVRINSRGGILDDGKSIYNSLRERSRRGARVAVHVDAIAASAASLIAVAGDEVTMSSNALMMIHEARASMLGARAADAARLGSVLEIENRFMADTYAGSSQRRGRFRTSAEFMAAMTKETYFTAAEAIAWGLADRVQQDAA